MPKRKTISWNQFTAKVEAEAKAKDEDKAKAKAEADAKAKSEADAKAKAESDAKASALRLAEDEANSTLKFSILELIAKKEFSFILGTLLLKYFETIPNLKIHQTKEIPYHASLILFEFLQIFLQMLAPFHTFVNCAADLEAIFYSVFVCWILKKPCNRIDTWLEITNPRTKGKNINTLDPKEIYGHMQTWMHAEKKSCDMQPWRHNRVWIVVSHITWEKVNLAMSKPNDIYGEGIYQNDEKGFAWICNLLEIPPYKFKECEKRLSRRYGIITNIYERESFYAANSPSHS